MAPSAQADTAAHSQANIQSENKQSLKVLEQLLSKLKVSTAPEDILGTSQEIATFINGDIEEEDAPVK